MAASAVVFCYTSILFSLFLLFNAVTTKENTTSYNLSTTVFGYENTTYNIMDNYTNTQPAEFDSTTPTPSYISTEEPVQPTLSSEPLPVSGSLLTPVTNGKHLLLCRTKLLNKFSVLDTL